jgi:hypothetical protein
MITMVLSSITGLLLFYAQPLRYYGKVFFWMKMVFLVLAGVNAMTFHFTTYRSVAKWDRDAVLPLGARLAGVFSLALWAGVVMTGRLASYNWLTYD